MENQKAKSENLQAVERGFLVLESLSRNGEMSLADLHKELKVGKSSLLRLIGTLLDRGYISRNEVTEKYDLTMKMYQVGAGSIQHKNKLTLINSVLTELHQKTGRIAQFSVEDDNMLLCLQSIGGDTSFLSAYTNSGYRSPLYCTSAGKAILATKSNTEIMEAWDSYHVHSFTPSTLVNVQDFLQDLSSVRRKKYAMDREEYEFGVFCIGTVLKGNVDQIIGAVSLSGSSLNEEEEKQLSSILLPTVNQLSRMLGYVAEL